MPSPPEELSPCDIIGRVDHLPHQPSQAGGGQGGQPQSPAGHSGGVHEHIIHTGDVEWHAWSEHDTGLGLPEVVHHGEGHENDIIGSASCECCDPDSYVETTMAAGVDEGDQAEEDEEELSQDKGRKHHEPLYGAVPVVPWQGVPLRVVREHGGRALGRYIRD